MDWYGKEISTKLKVRDDFDLKEALHLVQQLGWGESYISSLKGEERLIYLADDSNEGYSDFAGAFKDENGKYINAFYDLEYFLDNNIDFEPDNYTQVSQADVLEDIMDKDSYLVIMGCGSEGFRSLNGWVTIIAKGDIRHMNIVDWAQQQLVDMGILGANDSIF